MTPAMKFTIMVALPKNNRGSRPRIQGRAVMNQPPRQRPDPTVSIAMLISESVYRLVVLVETLLRWSTRFLFRPCLLQIRCLLW